MSTTEQAPPERSVPKPEFTDAEAGAKDFPGSAAESRVFEYFTPKKRRRTHYEDVTVDVQPDPMHYLAQGWGYAFSDGSAGYPTQWTALKAWGEDKPLPERYPGSGAAGYPWPASGWHEYRDPNGEWEQTIYEYNSDVVTQLSRNIDTARQTKAFAQWNPNWVRFVQNHVGAWMHVEHGLGTYVFCQAQRAAPTNMHNTVLAVNGTHKIRIAQDLALYNLSMTEELEGFDGKAHIETWKSDPVWQGVRETVERLTSLEDWAEANFATNVVFEPLLGELFRSRLVMHAAPANGDFITATVMGSGEYDYAQRDLRAARAMFELLSNDSEFGETNKATMQQWLSTWVDQCLTAARTLQPLWSQPDAKPGRFEDCLDQSKDRFIDLLKDLDLQPPEELRK